MTPTYHVDPILDAAGYDTIRPGDGTTNGDIDAQPIATVYAPDAAALLAAAPELRDALAAMVRAQAQYFDHADRRASLAAAVALLARIDGGAR